MANFTVEKYYLHDSNLELPTQNECYEAQQKVLNDLKEEEREYIQKEIRGIHYSLEYELVGAVILIKDRNSPYWADFTSYGVFTDPYTGIMVDNGGRFLYVLDELAKIKDIPKNEQAKNDLNNAYKTLKEGMDEHNLGKCFEAHQILHDYDYWIINTPVHLDVKPVDWGGVTTYFGKENIIEKNKGTAKSLYFELIKVLPRTIKINVTISRRIFYTSWYISMIISTTRNFDPLTGSTFYIINFFPSFFSLSHF